MAELLLKLRAQLRASTTASTLKAEQKLIADLTRMLNKQTNRCQPQDDEEDELETILFKKWEAPYSLQGDGAAKLAESSTSSEEDSEDEPIVDPTLVEQSLAHPISSALGSWEVHTKGVGWRLMARMGYVTGTGLGKHRDGRVSPIKADILPRGKSLDHCMLLREHAGVDENLLEVDRRLVKSRIEAQQQARRTQQQFWKQVRLLKRKNECDRQTRQLEIRRAVRDVAQLAKSLSRHSTGSTRHSRIAEKLKDKQGELNQLQASECSIDQERSIRKDRKKLSIF